MSPPSGGDIETGTNQPGSERSCAGKARGRSVVPAMIAVVVIAVVVIAVVVIAVVVPAVVVPAAVGRMLVALLVVPTVALVDDHFADVPVPDRAVVIATVDVIQDDR